MFARIKKSGKYEYLQLVENKKVNKQTKQRVVATLGRLDELQDKGRIETLIRSLLRFSKCKWQMGDPNIQKPKVRGNLAKASVSSLFARCKKGFHFPGF